MFRGTEHFRAVDEGQTQLSGKTRLSRDNDDTLTRDRGRDGGQTLDRDPGQTGEHSLPSYDSSVLRVLPKGKFSASTRFSNSTRRKSSHATNNPVSPHQRAGLSEDRGLWHHAVSARLCLDVMLHHIEQLRQRGRLLQVRDSIVASEAPDLDCEALNQDSCPITLSI